MSQNQNNPVIQELQVLEYELRTTKKDKVYKRLPNSSVFLLQDKQSVLGQVRGQLKDEKAQPLK